MTGEHWHSHARAAHEKVGKAENLARLVTQFALLAGLIRAIIKHVACHGEHIERDGLDVHSGLREVDSAAVARKGGGAVDDALHLSVEFAHTRHARPRNSLVGRHNEATQPSEVVKCLEDRHRRHRGAVRVRNDALGDRIQRVRVDLGDDKRHVGVHAPRGRVVDNDRASLSKARSVRGGCRTTCGEQGNVNTRVVRSLHILNGDIRATVRKRRPC